MSGLSNIGLIVQIASRHDVDWMIKKHYLGKWPGVVVSIYALMKNGVFVGVCVFALPPRQTVKRYGAGRMGNCVWELARLWVCDELPKNTETWFIARVLAMVRARRDVSAVVSYADPSAGHLGTIYRAGNWLSDGRTDEGRKTPRCDYQHNGKRFSRRSHVPVGITPTRVPRVSKYRFVMGMNRFEHKRLARQLAAGRPLAVAS